MNERIKELKRRAEEYSSKYGIDHSIYGQDVIDVLDQKFAELIVKECLYVVKLAHGEGNEGDYSYDDALDHVEYNMKQHFGVEE